MGNIKEIHKFLYTDTMAIYETESGQPGKETGDVEGLTYKLN